MNKLIIITGPTGSGKTELAVRLAKKFNGEIIGADSRQIYRGMKIGTAAPCKIKGKVIGLWDQQPVWSLGNGQGVKTKKPMTMTNDYTGCRDQQPRPRPMSYCLYKGVPHYLIGFLEPNKIFSAAEFKEMAQQIANDIISRDKVPIICGGTAFYLHALTENLELPRVLPNWKLRKKLENKNLKILIKQLKKLDSAALKIVDLKNKRRVMRAIEVCFAGYKFSEFGSKGKPLFNILQIGVDVPREELYKRIDARVEKMIKGGLVKETKKLLLFFGCRLPSVAARFVNRQSLIVKNRKTANEQRNGLRASINERRDRVESFNKRFTNIPALSGIGYKEIIDYLAGKTSLKEASQLIKYRTHRYVRGQMGWFRKNKDIKWVKNYKEAEKKIKFFLKR